MEQKLKVMVMANMIDQQIANDVLVIRDKVLMPYIEDEEKIETLLTHLAMALCRLKKQEDVEAMPESIVEQIVGHCRYAMAQEVLNEMEIMLSNEFDQHEHNYLLLHLCNSLEHIPTQVLKPGYTLMHEHVTIDLSYIKGDDDTRLDCFEETVDELKALYRLGVRNIVDVTLEGMGRNLEYVQQIEARTGIRIIKATGFYKEPFLPKYVEVEEVEVLAQVMVDELTIGIDETRVKASIIGEIGTSLNEATMLEKKVFDAAILAYHKTRAPITTHTTLGRLGMWQAQYLIDRGVRPQDIIIGHQDLTGDVNQLIALIDLGVTVGIDTVGKENYLDDDIRVQMIKTLEALNKTEYIVLSMDITRKSNLKYQGGIGYDYLFDVFLPKLRDAGVKEETINQILIDNPRRILNKEVI